MADYIYTMIRATKVAGRDKTILDSIGLLTTALIAATIFYAQQHGASVIALPALRP